MSEPKNYTGPYIFGGPNTLELFRRAGYPEYMLKLSKPIPSSSAPTAKGESDAQP